MSPIGDTGSFDGGTESITWVGAEQARELILLTTKPRRQRRDLRVLKLGFRLFESLRSANENLFTDVSAFVLRPAGE